MVDFKVYLFTQSATCSNLDKTNIGSIFNSYVGIVNGNIIFIRNHGVQMWVN